MTWAATPQHAVEKKCGLKAVATAPNTHASGDSFHCRKQKKAQMPKMKMAAGQKIFEKMSGVVINRKAEEMEGEGVGFSLPIQFRSCQKPFMIPGILFCFATMAPRGPSFEKMTS